MANQYQIPQIQYTNQQPYQIPQVQQYQQPVNQLPTVGVFWVQGLAGAQGYQVNSANTEVYLRDSNDNDILYVKTTDQFGRPNTLRKYRMSEEVIEETASVSSNFVTVDQLNDILDEKLNKLADKFNKPKQNQGKRNNGSRRNNNRRYEEEYDDEE